MAVLGSGVGSPLAGDLVRGRKQLTHTFWLWQRLRFRRDGNRWLYHLETPPEQGLGRKSARWFQHQLLQRLSSPYPLHIPSVSSPVSM